jgi:hypothetical protein
MVWRIVYMAFSITPPKNIKIYLVIGWWGFKKLRRHTFEWEHVLCFGPYGGLGMTIFNNAKTTSFMQVIPLATHWIHMWSFLQQMEKRGDLVTGCNRLEKVARDLYSQCNWRFDLLLTF